MSLSPATTSQTSSSPPHFSPTSSIPFDQITLDVLKHVFSFVGRNQYRFIAGVNRCFREAHLEAFPEDKRTYLNASTEKLARFCWSEMHPPNMYWHVLPGLPTSYYVWQSFLCESAAKYGNLPSLQYLRSVNCIWGRQTSAKAAGNGHLEILKNGVKTMVARAINIRVILLPEMVN